MKKLNIFVLVVLSMFLVRCGGDEDNNPDQEVLSTDYRYFMSGKINGTPFIVGSPKSESVLSYVLGHAGGTTGACAGDFGGVSYYTFIAPYQDQTLPSMGIDFVKFILCPELDTQSQTTIFNSKFPVGDYIFAVDDSSFSSGTDRSIKISYSPNYSNALEYDSLGDQTGSFFKITSSLAESTSSQIVEGIFSVKLYNTANVSDIIEITEGKFKMIPSIN